LFVQLLSDQPGRLLEDAELGRIAVQNEMAGACLPAEKILRWCRRGLDVQKVDDPAHAELLRSTGLVACDLINEFLPMLRSKLTPPAKADPGVPADDHFVFINADEPDDPLVDALLNRLAPLPWVTCAGPLRSDDPKANYESLRVKLEECDELVVVFGEAKPE